MLADTLRAAIKDRTPALHPNPKVLILERTSGEVFEVVDVTYDRETENGVLFLKVELYEPEET